MLTTIIKLDLKNATISKKKSIDIDRAAARVYAAAAKAIDI